MDSHPWPRVVGAAALAVLGACGAILLVFPPRSNSSTSLASRSNWSLAGALPTSRDFPADWGYGLYGFVRRTPAPVTVASTHGPRSGPRAVYAPAACTKIPTILDHSGAALAAGLGVDRYTELLAREAELSDAAATGESDEQGPNAQLQIWMVPDGPARIANYLDWLGRCGSYQVTNYDFDGKLKDERTATTAVEAGSAEGADAAVTVTRTFTTDGDHPPSVYHVIYYALRGVIVECRIYMQGAELDLVKRRAAETVQRLRAL